MSKDDTGNAGTLGCEYKALGLGWLAGVVSALLLLLLGAGLIWALLIGLIVGIGGGVALLRVVCPGNPDGLVLPGTTARQPAEASPAAPVPTPVAASDAGQEPVVEPASDLEPVSEVDPEPAPVPLAAASTVPDSDPEPVPNAVAAPEDLRHEDAADAGDLADARTEPVLGEERVETASGAVAPRLMDAPPPEGGDDLKQIRGVGPKLESLLHEMGVWTFDQIAGWGEAELDWVDERLDGFTGRARRDDWVGQARELK